jgi:hypothetical protein
VIDGIVYVDCNQKPLFQPVEFMFEEYYFQVDPEHYIWDQNGDNSVCTMLIMANKYNFFIIGQPLFQGYYTMHDMA